jgi:hypothetical protein
METSVEIAKLAEALSKAQASVEGAVKGKVNPAFRTKYADLASVWDACREALTTNGLSVIQSPGPISDGRMEMTTMLLHASGEWVRGSLTIPLGKVDAQSYGSATTYARRYALAAFVGVAPDDDDGNAASKAKPAANQSGGGSSPGAGKAAEYEVGQGRKSAAQAKRDGDDATIKADIAKCDKDGLREWHERFDDYTAHLPLSWLDSIRDMLELRLEELNGATEVDADQAALDEAFRASVGPASPAPVARRGHDREAA